ncbi:MAG: class I SAM-dependent methyltransferase [Oscillatoriales cyanobacterium SM2_1_8]|nr:class I SAM-dependent methyltransferase [Oscillatoriales cyanobacterium SM2_1_8]
MEYAFTAKVLNAYDVDYFYCQASGLLQTELPYWLDHAYQNAISDLDVGILLRNETNAQVLPWLLELLEFVDKSIVDVACGYGILPRMLRDRGFDCYGFDKYCQNLFAKHFEPPLGLNAGLLLAFETLEHVFDPVSFLEEVFTRFNCRNLIFSTLTFEDSIPTLDWWYYVFETGQHITFYQPRTLSMIAEKLGCYYLSLSPELHLYTEKPLSFIQGNIITSRRLLKAYTFWYNHLKRSKKMSKLSEDMSYIKRKFDSKFKNLVENQEDTD